MSESDQISPEDQQDTMEETNPMEEVDEFEQELVWEQEKWDRLGHGIMLSGWPQWMSMWDPLATGWSLGSSVDLHH
ncbi:hypothetical protein AAF712_013637 [Marasmius tenuissimus]|uniref:Uncharacterized protein n=1 Tax=Marasmius tenuissimus TaxID=585030 RepID=A0ABR2ZD55_9AGAR